MDQCHGPEDDGCPARDHEDQIDYSHANDCTDTLGIAAARTGPAPIGSGRAPAPTHNHPAPAQLRPRTTTAPPGAVWAPGGEVEPSTPRTRRRPAVSGRSPAAVDRRTRRPHCGCGPAGRDHLLCVVLPVVFLAAVVLAVVVLAVVVFLAG